VCARAVGLAASFPSDPADRLIVATALLEGIPLVTADDEIRRSKAVTTIW
jgi:PIN domain nuclease of toxin-antitoxin system